MRAWSSPAIKRHWPNLGPFQPAPRDDALLPWATALSLQGRHWMEGRARGITEAALMEALWRAS